jgi:HAD superfamily hydrolase (TIGR01509 family)
MKTILVDAAHCFTIEKEEKFEIFKEMHELLETYSNKKIVLSGADDEQVIKFALDNIPYELFTLKHNPEKTDPKYYEILLEKFNLNKNEVIYFEHNIEAVKSAESIGIKSYFYDSDKKDLESLKNFLDENLK